MLVMRVLLVMLMEDCPVARKKEAVCATKPLIVLLRMSTWL